MKITRDLIALVALTYVTVAPAGENRWFAGKYRPAASPSAASEPAASAGGNQWFAGKYRPAAPSSGLITNTKTAAGKNIKP